MVRQTGIKDATVDIKLIFNFFIYVLACEAMVSLWVNGAPLRPTRRFLKRITPFLYSKESEEHLFDCKYCTSVWVAALVIFLGYFGNYYTILFLYGLAIHRLSNYIHLVFSYLRDLQFDIRVNRR